MNNRAEQVLWGDLDSRGIEFRETQSSLIAKYGRRDCGWTSHLEYCEISGFGPFVEGLAHPIVFPFQPSTFLLLQPDAFFGYVRASANCIENLQLVVEQLTCRFGEGHDASVSNTIATQWRFGRAQVCATIFPPELNSDHGNRRYAMIKDSRSECSITIRPAWCPTLTHDQSLWLRSYEPIFVSQTNHQSNSFPHSPLVREPLEEFAQNSAGFGVCRAKNMLVAHNFQDLLEVLPLAWATNLSCLNLLPAKGPGGALLQIRYIHPDAPRSELTLQLAESSNPGSFDELAASLAEEWRLGLDKQTDFDA